MPNAIRRLTLILGTKNAQALKGITAFKTALKGLQRLAKIVAVATVSAMAIIGGASIAAAASFEDAMVKSTAIMGDLSQQMTNDLTNAAREIALVTKFSAKEAAESYFFLASAGMDAAQSMKALPVVAQFAQAGNFDMALATDLLTDAQTALGLSSKDVAENQKNLIRISDVFVQANKIANTSVQQISEALVADAATAARGFGADLETTVAVLSAYASAGKKGAEGGNLFGRAVRLLTKAQRENGKVFEELGITVIDKVTGKYRNLIDIVKDMENAFEGMTLPQRDAKLELLGFAALAQKSITPLIGLSSQMREYKVRLKETGATQEIAAKQLKSVTAQFGLLKDEITDIAIGIGTKLLPAVRKIIPIIRKAIRATVNWIDSNKELIALFSGIAIAITLITSPIAMVGAAVLGLILLWRKFGDSVKRVVNEAIQGWAVFFKTIELHGELMVEKFKLHVDALMNLARSGALAITGDLVGALINFEIGSKDIQASAEALDMAFEHLTKSSLERILGTDYVGVLSDKMDQTIEAVKAKVRELGNLAADAIGIGAGAGVGGGRTATPVLEPPQIDRFKEPLEAIKVVMQEVSMVTKQSIVSIQTPIDDLLLRFDTFAEKLMFIKDLMSNTFGVVGVTVFQTALGAADAYYSTISEMSQAFFSGETKRLLNFGVLIKQIWKGAAAAAIDSIGDELSVLAKKWGLQAIAAAAAGNFISAGKFAAAAAGAGGAAALAKGAAAGIRQSAQQDLREGLGQPSPLTQAQRDAGVTTPRGRAGSLTRSGTVTQAGPTTIIIQPQTTFNTHDGGILIIGTGGIEEAAEAFGDVIVERILEAKRGGQV